MNQNNNKEESCPLCDSSKEALEKLKLNSDFIADLKKTPSFQGGDELSSDMSSSFKGYSARKSGEDVINNPKSKPFWKGVIILSLIALGIFAVYGFRSNFSSPTTSNSELTQVTSLQKGDEKNKPQINALAPEFITEDVFGNKVTLSDFRGKKPVLLVFWATWCGDCAKEKDDLKTFTNRYQDKIQVLAVDSGEPKQTIKDYFREKNINFLMLMDEQRKIWNQYLIRGTPSHFLIDKDGKIITMRPGLAFLADLETMLSMVSAK